MEATMDQVQENPFTTVDVKPGGFWRRFAAYMIDAIILSIALAPLNILSSGSAMMLESDPESAALAEATIVSTLAYMIGAFVVSFCYSGYFLSKKGRLQAKWF